MLDFNPFGRLLVAIALLHGTASIGRGEEPPRPGDQVRFDIIANEAVGALGGGKIGTGFGTVEREVWKPVEDQDGGYVIRTQASPYAWNKIVFRFQPERAGEIRIELKGPWAESEPGSGKLLKLEVLWDKVLVDGKLIKPAWRGGRVVGAKKAICAWHNDAAIATFMVEGGKAVEISLSAKPILPEGTDRMARIKGENTPAHRAAKLLRRGINISNCLETAADGRVEYTEADFKAIKREGFDHVRIPVAWHFGSGAVPDFEIDRRLFRQVDQFVDWAIKNRLAVIVDWHHFDLFSKEPENDAHTAQLISGWRQIAEHFRGKSRALFFELLNEPHGAATTAMVNQLYPKLIGAIRESNPSRTILLGPGDYNGIGDLELLRLPVEDDNLIVAVHFYDPFIFTHQGAEWLGDLVSTTGIRFPGPPPEPITREAEGWLKDFLKSYNSAPVESNPCGRNAIAGRLQSVGHWSDYYGRPVHVGEFGCYEAADPESRVNYCGTVRRELERAGLGWAMWEWKSGFGYIRDGKPNPPGMRAALFGD